jgi:hypothetical protein
MTGLVNMFLQYRNEINNVTRHGDRGVSANRERCRCQQIKVSVETDKGVSANR